MASKEYFLQSLHARMKQDYQDRASQEPHSEALEVIEWSEDVLPELKLTYKSCSDTVKKETKRSYGFRAGDEEQHTFESDLAKMDEEESDNGAEDESVGDNGADSSDQQRDEGNFITCHSFSKIAHKIVQQHNRQGLDN